MEKSVLKAAVKAAGLPAVLLALGLVFGLALIGCKPDDGGGSDNLSFSGTWSKDSGSDETTLIISLTTGAWSSDAYVDGHRNIGGTFVFASETNGSLKTRNPNNTGNAVLSNGKLYVTGFFGGGPSPVNGTYTKKNDDDDVGDYYDGYWT
jgi:hypothetical protein